MLYPLPGCLLRAIRSTGADEFAICYVPENNSAGSAEPSRVARPKAEGLADTNRFRDNALSVCSRCCYFPAPSGDTACASGSNPHTALCGTGLIPSSFYPRKQYSSPWCWFPTSFPQCTYSSDLLYCAGVQKLLTCHTAPLWFSQRSEAVRRDPRFQAKQPLAQVVRLSCSRWRSGGFVLASLLRNFPGRKASDLGTKHEVKPLTRAASTGRPFLATTDLPRSRFLRTTHSQKARAFVKPVRFLGTFEKIETTIMNHLQTAVDGGSKEKPTKRAGLAVVTPQYQTQNPLIQAVESLTIGSRPPPALSTSTECYEHFSSPAHRSLPWTHTTQSSRLHYRLSFSSEAFLWQKQSQEQRTNGPLPLRRRGFRLAGPRTDPLFM